MFVPHEMVATRLNLGRLSLPLSITRFKSDLKFVSNAAIIFIFR